MAKEGPVKREAKAKAFLLQFIDSQAIEKSMWDLSYVRFGCSSRGKNLRKADAALRKTIDANSFVVTYMLGIKSMPDKVPEYMGFGESKVSFM